MKTPPFLLDCIRRRPLGLALMLCAAGQPAAHGYTVGITPGVRALFLQVGAGTMTGGTFESGCGTPGNNGTVNSGSVAAELGSGSLAGRKNHGHPFFLGWLRHAKQRYSSVLATSPTQR